MAQTERFVTQPDLLRTSLSAASPNNRTCGQGTAMDAQQIYFGSNGGASRSFCSKLEKLGPLGRIAAQLFRVQKASTRAKAYRGGIRRSDGKHFSYRDMAYDRKGECIEALSRLLDLDDCGLKWGWGRDEKQRKAKYVLYIELPVGQVSFHCTSRYGGKDFAGEWDGLNLSQERVIEFCQRVFNEGENK